MVATINTDLLVKAGLEIEQQPTVGDLPAAFYQRLSFPTVMADPDFPGASLSATNGYPGWEFHNNAVNDEAILVSWAPPRIGREDDGATDLFWESLRIALVGINISAGSGNMRFQIQVGKYDIFLDSVTETEFYDQTITMAAGAQNVMSAYIFSTQLDLTPGIFGTEWRMRIKRLTFTDALDTLAGSFRMGVCSFNQFE